MSPVRLCLQRGCNARVSDGSYCPTHERQRLAKRQAARRGDVRQSYKWRVHVRPAVLRRDGHRCVRCGAGPEGLQVHHTDGDHSHMDMARLETLCPSCHGQAGKVLKFEQPKPPGQPPPLIA